MPQIQSGIPPLQSTMKPKLHTGLFYIRTYPTVSCLD